VGLARTTAWQEVATAGACSCGCAANVGCPCPGWHAGAGRAATSVWGRATERERRHGREGDVGRGGRTVSYGREGEERLFFPGPTEGEEGSGEGKKGQERDGFFLNSPGR